MDTAVFSKYKAELEEELDLSEFNVHDVQMKMPSIKHKWVARLIEQKIELNKLKNIKRDAVSVVVEQNKSSNNTTLSDPALVRQAEKSDIIKKINSKIEECEILIEYLEKVERVCNSTTFDIKNLVEIKKMELA